MAYDTSKPKGDMDLIGGGGGSGTSTQYGSQFKAESGEMKTDLIAVGAIILGIVVLIIGVKVFIRMMRKPVEKGKKKDAKELKDTPPDADPMDFEAYDGDEPPWEEEQHEEQVYRTEHLTGGE